MSSFTAQYKDDIQARMVGELAKVDDKTAIEGSFSRDVINANSIEFQNAYAEMDLISQAMFADTAWGEYLTARAAEYGIDRKRAQAAQVALTLTGTAGARVPKTSLFDTADGSVQFRTDLAVTIGEDGKATVSATAQAKGTAGNVAAGTSPRLFRASTRSRMRLPRTTATTRRRMRRCSSGIRSPCARLRQVEMSTTTTTGR